MDNSNINIESFTYDEKSSSISINNDVYTFYAHPKEILNDHLIKTVKVFNSLVNEEILLNFHKKLQNEGFIDLDYSSFRRIIEDCIYFHDYGKLSFKFQNKLNKEQPLEYNSQLDFLNKYDKEGVAKYSYSNHSLLGALLFLEKYNNIDDINKPFILLLSGIIEGHHTKLRDINFESGLAYDDNVINDNGSFKGTFTLLSYYLKLIFKNSLNNIQIFQNNYSNILKNLQTGTVAFLYNYLYSLIITSDVIASSKSEININDDIFNNNSNRIDLNMLERMKKSFFNVDYNKNWDRQLDNPSTINDLRLKMFQESSENLKKGLKNNPNNRIFFLNMPTGSGKTNVSMKLALDIVSNTEADRIIYAMPFINIIEQNYNIIRDNYNLNEDNFEIRKIYSASESIFPEQDDEFKSQVVFADQFFNYPVLCTTFVGLFNSLISSKKKSKYSFNSLSNSVIILDEIQSLPIKNWNSLYYLINELALNYNTYFIIMSATLPSFEDLKLDKDNKFTYPKIDLIKEPKFYFNSPLFNRTKINDYKILNLDDDDFIEYYLDKIIKNFENNYNKGLIVLNTIKSSRRVFDLLYNYKDTLNFELNLLNGSLLSSSKNYVIKRINEISDDERYILVSTQSIEAGVDVSFDFVFRDFATLDSIEQVRGRCNRSGELYKRFNNTNKKGNIYLTKIKDKRNRFLFEYIYTDIEKQTKIEETSNIIENELNYDYSIIEDYYNKVSDKINIVNDKKEDNFIVSDRENIKNWNQFNFSNIEDKKTGIKIIDNKMKQHSIFVESDLNIFNYMNTNQQTIEKLNEMELKKLYEKYKGNFTFTLNEIKYLKQLKNNILFNNQISGHKLITYYKMRIKELKEDNNYGKYKIFKKEFSSILNKFIFNITLSKEELVDEIESLEKLSYFYIIPQDKIGEDENSIYSIEKGFNFEPIKTWME